MMAAPTQPVIWLVAAQLFEGFCVPHQQGIHNAVRTGYMACRTYTTNNLALFDSVASSGVFSA